MNYELPNRNGGGCRLLDLAREVLAAKGHVEVEVAQLSLQTTSAFPSILANVANKFLQACNS